MTETETPMPFVTNLLFSALRHMPAAVFGAIIVIALVAGHLLGVVWNSLPILLSVFGMFVSFAWFVANAERLVLATREGLSGDSLGLNMFFAAVLLVGSIIFTCVTWSGAHPGPPGPPPPPPPPLQTSCKDHGGVMMEEDDKGKNKPKIEQTEDSYHHITYHVTCNDGSGFTRD